MIIIRLTGGLGNQMFMYAFARAIQLQTKERIYISQYCYRHLPSNLTKRKYALNCFRMKNNVKVLSFFEELVFEEIYKIKKLIYQYRNVAEIINNQNAFLNVTKHGLYMSDDMFRYYKKFSMNSKIKYVDSLFMSWHYFEKCNLQIQKDFQFCKKSSEKNKKILKEIMKCNSVCVHVRLGDYLSKEFKKSNFICDEKYFLKAMDEINENVTNPVYYIFSTSKEDIEFIKRSFNFKYPVKFVEQENVDYEELNLMKHCKHFILSNSSFSWWAQYLSRNKDKIVVAPSRWMNNKIQYTKDLYSDKWNIVDV